uniref:Nuclear hormone receptor family member nhr-71 n=1 Tax=Ascaris suum TaxID=6253 RepID=F1KW61_ASCSU
MSVSNSANMDEAIIIVDDDQDSSLMRLRTRHKQFNDEGVQRNVSQLQTAAHREHDSLPSSPASRLIVSTNCVADDGNLVKRDSTSSLPCTICGSPSNGYHFGALSCAACNAFFRRSVAESRKYFCRKDGDCVIDQNARCFCRACRLKKCLEKGMDPNAVQPHRDIIGQKRKRQFDERRRDVPDSALTVAIDSVEPEQQSQTTYKLLPLSPHSGPHNNSSAALQGLSLSESTSFSLLNSKKEISPTKHSGSATAQLLTSPSAIAEQLLAFSRTPLIAASREERMADLQKSANGVHQPFPKKNSPITSVSEPPSVNSATAQGAFPQSGLGRARLSTSECHAAEVHMDSERVMHYVPYDEYHQDLEHEEIVEHYDNGPSTSDSWYYEGGAERKQWQHTGSIPRGCSPAGAGYDPSTNQIEHLVHAYAMLRERRRLIYCRGTLRDILSGSEPPLRPATVGEHCSSHLRVEAGLVTEFINAIHPYAKLRLDDRILLLKKASVPYLILEKHYITMRLGGYQANRIINMDYSYHDLSLGTEKSSACSENDTSKTAKPLSSSENDSRSVANENGGKRVKVDPETVRRLLVLPLRESMRSITAPMYHFGMTDVEFVALVVIILFDHTLSGLSEPTRRLVKEARDRIYRDWFAYYEAHGIIDGPQRVGNAMLILPALKASCDLQSENYHLVRFFGFFEMDKIIDEVML